MKLTLINNILDHRKCEANMMQSFQLQPVPLRNSMTEVLTFCRPLAQITNVSLKLDLGKNSDVAILSNPTRFGQIMINLVSNAIKYTKKGTTVELRTRIVSMKEVDTAIEKAAASTQKVENTLDSREISGNVAVISVTDCGNGLPKSDARALKLFGKFAQLQNNESATILGSETVGQSSGTGLGLSICAGFVEQMRGRIWATSTDEGACFSFYCPLADISNKECAGLLEAKTLGDVTCTSNGGEMTPSVSQLRIMVVDDTPINLKVLKRMLVGIGVGNVSVASSGEEACAILKEKPFDLIITDIQMPGGMSGTELSDSIRKSDMSRWSHQTQPIVVGLTAGESAAALYQDCADSGMSHVLHKPMTSVQVRDFLVKVLPALEPNNCAYGNLSEL